MDIVYINCSKYPFIDLIMKGKKLYETRNKNTLKNLVNRPIYLAETGKGKRPVIRCICVITEVITITDKAAYNRYRKYTRVEKGSAFDFIAGKTKQKVLYHLDNVQPVTPFTMPENVIKHGRIYATTF